MDLILVADCLDSTRPLLKVAFKAGYRIMKLIESNDDASHYVTSLRPDVLIFVSDEIDRMLLHQMRAVTDKQPTPNDFFYARCAIRIHQRSSKGRIILHR